MCLKYKYSYVFTINTEYSQAVPDLGVVTEFLSLSLPHTYTQKTMQCKPTNMQHIHTEQRYLAEGQAISFQTNTQQTLTV